MNLCLIDIFLTKKRYFIWLLINKSFINYGKPGNYEVLKDKKFGNKMNFLKQFIYYTRVE